MSLPRPRSADTALLAAARMLIASYFLVSAGLIPDASDATALSALLPGATAEAVATTLFYAAGFAILIGRFVREAALVLALFVAWSALSDDLLAAQPAALIALWKDLALVGAVFLLGQAMPRRQRGASATGRRPDRVAKVTPKRPVHPLTQAADDEEKNIFADLKTV